MTPSSRFWLRRLRPVLVVGVGMLVLSLFPVEGDLDTPGEFVARGVVLLCINAFAWLGFPWFRRHVEAVHRDGTARWLGGCFTSLVLWQVVGLAVFVIFLLLLDLAYFLQVALALQ